MALVEPRKYLPFFFDRDAARLVRGYEPGLFEAADKVGIRPQLVDWTTKELVMDFLVEARDASVHVLNPVSPAFTAAATASARPSTTPRNAGPARRVPVRNAGSSG